MIIAWILNRIKNVFTRTQKLKLFGTGFGFYAKNAVPYKFQNLEKRFSEQVILIFALPLTTANRKRVNSGGSPKNAAPRKSAHMWALPLS